MNQDFEIVNGKLIKYHGTDETVIIPDSVTSIGDHAFSLNRRMKSVIIPDSVTEIEKDAFALCMRLTSVNIPDSVTSIGDYAFSGCASLTSVSIPDSVTSIGFNAFSRTSWVENYFDDFVVINGILIEYKGSDSNIILPDNVTDLRTQVFSSDISLTAIGVSENNPAYTSENGVLFNKGKTKLIRYPSGNDRTEYVIPDSVTSIGDSAFEGCTNLISVMIPDSVTSIGDAVFNNCKSLISVNIPDGVTSIGDYLFSDCSALASVNIPDGVTSIGDSAFSRCESLISVIIPESVTSIGDFVFQYCSGLTSVIIPDSVTSIGFRAFYKCKNLTSVSIPDSITEIGEDAFLNCKKLKHAPLMLIEGKMLYEPENRDDVSFSEICQLVQKHDYSMNMVYAVKYHLIFQMYALGIDKEEISAYISKNFFAMIPFMIDMDDIELIQKILDSEKIITKENIDDLIRCAIDHEKYQIQIMLTDYKRQKNWYQDIDEITDKFKL